MWREIHTLRLVLVVLPVITCVSRAELVGLEDDAILPCEFQVHVQEDTPIGKVIFTLRNGNTTITKGSMPITGHHHLLADDESVNTTSWDDTSSNASSSMTETMGTISSQSGYEGVRIIDGNKNDRFKMNAVNGDILVNGYLDYDIDSEYTLGITLPNGLEALQSTCSIKIVVDDVIDWPPYHNDTCEMPTRGSNLPFAVFFGTLKVPLEHIIGTSLHDLVEGDMNNGKCMTTAFWRYKTRTDHHDYRKVNLHAKCFHNGIHHTLYPYKEDFPPDAIINKNWFDDNPSGKTRYSLVQVTFENINTTLSPLQVHCSVDIEDRPTFSETFWIDYIGCPRGTYGNKPCICKNEAKCSVFNGACKCTSGWHGPACDIPKASIMMVPQRSESQYGYFMILTCSSENIDLPNTKDEWKKSITWYHDEKYLHLKNKTHAIYIHQEFPGISHLQIKWVTEMTEGAYECHIMDKYNKKYIATATVIAKCPVNRFGRYCNKSCDCLTYSSTSCDRYDGCICKQGWNGTRCQHDLIPPVILRCPKDITQYTESGKAYTNVTWLVPAVEDNSDDVILFSNHNPSDLFQEGTTLVRYTAIDSSNNTHHCRFKIHVIKSKEFDAMVLYSSKDEDFAEDIAARLEENKSLKLLLHERDFPVGGGILENIIEAFEKSRASILILSQAFLESGYCMHEAEIALDSWITKRRKLIPIFKESIERKKIPAVIDDIMSSITYFEWHRVQTEQDEDKFWNKLQRALTKPNRKSSLVSSVRKTIVRLFGQNGAVSYTRLNNQVV